MYCWNKLIDSDNKLNLTHLNPMTLFVQSLCKCQYLSILIGKLLGILEELNLIGTAALSMTWV